VDQEKRRHRQLKRSVKRAGKKKVRQQLKRDLADNPENAAHAEIDYGRDSSADLNGNDRDATRQREINRKDAKSAKKDEGEKEEEE
jgi:hypothetical protein